MISNKQKYVIRLCFFSLCGVMSLWACTAEKSGFQEHYYLKGYDHLEFRDTLGNPVPVSQYLYSNTNINGYRSYGIRDTTLLLVHKRSGDPYTGYIRTFHKNTYNLQGEYRNGKMFRLRYWHPNRTLGMDADYNKKNTSLWDASGNLVAAITPKETYYYYQGTQKIKEIRRDTIHSFFNIQGELTRYNIFTDSTMTFYYADGSPRLQLPYREGKTRDGLAKRWHPNGQLQAIGEYKNGKQYGTWIEYDSLGNEIKREVFNPMEQHDKEVN